MAINGFPVAITGTIEQPGYLERKFLESAEAHYGYRPAATIEPIESGNGETVTKSRPQLLTPKTTAINPANNTGLDNGLTPSNRGFEQYQLAISTWADTLNLSLEQSETLISSLFIDNVEKLGRGAAQTLDSLAALSFHSAYDSGDTFAIATAAAAATTVKLDNCTGFDTNFNAALSPSLGLPSAVSSSNTVPYLHLDGTSGAIKNAGFVQAVTPDGTNVSTAYYGGIAYGYSGTVTLSAGLTNAVAVGDRFVAMDRGASTTVFNALWKDGATVIRPNGKATRAALTNSDTLTLSLFAQAKAKLGSRGIQPMRNGMYLAVVDEILMAQLQTDSQFITATQGTWDISPVFRRGVIAKGMGLEFVPSTSVPVFMAGTGNSILARHAAVLGEGALVEGPFVGTERAARQSASMGISDFRMVDRILMITRPGIDRFGDIIAQTYKYTGAFAAPTDKGSNPNVIPQSDWARYKRGVVIECGSSF